MSLKEQAGFVKEALSGDEKILESAFKLEKIYKKHKFKIWGVLIALVLFFGGTAAMNAYQSSKLSSANDALLALQKDSADATALNTLKDKNPKLYELFTYMNALKSGDSDTLKRLESSSDEIIADISKYNTAALNSKAVDSKYYQDLTLVSEAYEALKSGKKEIAKQKLAMIVENSPVAKIAKLLEHYAIEVK